MIWKDIIGYEGYYKINRFGEVRGIDRLIYHGKKGFISIAGKTLSPAKIKGYKMVVLSKNDDRKICFIHRLVATHFVSNPNNHSIVNHKNGDKEFNFYLNLEWCTSSHNNKHAWENKLNLGRQKRT